jgi:hypothetical protein
MVDDQGVPVEVEEHHPTAGTRHPYHLRQRPAGIREVLQQPGRPADVELAVGERKRLYVPNLEG